MDPMPSILVGLLITGLRTHFILPRVGVPVLEIAPTDATHVSSLPMTEGFLLCFIVCFV